jgi:SSS family solute:Na+ symporter
LEFCDLTGFPNAKRIGTDALLLCLYGFWIIHPVLGALFWKKSHPIAAFGYACWRSNYNLLIITENKLPLGKTTRTFRRKYLWNKYFAAIIRYNINLS